MRKFLLMLVAFATFATVSITARADDNSDFEELSALLENATDDQKVTILCELLNAKLQEVEDSPINAVWFDKDSNNVVFAMNIDGETIDQINLMPTVFKAGMLSAMTEDDDDMKDFVKLIGSTGHGLGFFLHSPDDDQRCALIEFTAEELVAL